MTIVRTEILHDLPDTQVFLFRGSMINVSGGGGSRSIVLDLQGPEINKLMAGAQAGLSAIKEAMPTSPARPVPALQLAEPELELIPNDRRITQSGLSRRNVANTVRAFTGGLFVSEYFDGNNRMNVILKGKKWDTPDELASLPIFTPLAGIQLLGELVEIKRTVGPTQLRRVNGNRTISLIITPPPHMSLQEAMDIIDVQVLPKIREQLPSSASLQLNGNGNRMNEAIIDMGLNFLLAIMILFLLMTALFKSAKDSLIVLLVMPLAIAGGVLALSVLNLFSFQSLDLLTMIGFIILLGLVVNNAILLVDQTRSAQKEGLSRTLAVKQAVRIRARPVYMSTLTSIFGMLPLMLLPGVGSEIYRGLAAVIIGGMTVSALFTLILMPSLLQLGNIQIRSRFKNMAKNESPKDPIIES